MKRFTQLEALFILVAFGLIYTTINASPVTGNTTLELSENTYTRITVNSGDAFFIQAGENLYEVQALRIHQDYNLNLEVAQFMIDVGNKRVSITEGEAFAVDLDNSGEDDMMIWVESISQGRASLVVIS